MSSKRSSLPTGQPILPLAAFFGIFGTMLFIIGLVAMTLLLPDYLRQRTCPIDTFLSGPMGSEWGLLSALLLLPAVFAVLVSVAAKPRENAPPFAQLVVRNRAAFGFAGVAALLLAVFGWLGSVFSFYCATPSAILLHPELMRSYERLEWKNVSAVTARCWGGARTPWQGGLNITLDTGDEVLMRLGSGRGLYGPRTLARNYEAIRSALNGQSYQYDASAIGRCPTNIAALLINWQN